MDVSPVINDVTVIIGLFTPFLTAIVIRAKDHDWIKGAVSILAAVVAGIVISAGHDAGFDLNDTINQATGIVSIHIVSWLMVTGALVKRVSDRTAGFGLDFGLDLGR